MLRLHEAITIMGKAFLFAFLQDHLNKEKKSNAITRME